MTTVIGAGAFGTALAISIARGGRPVTLWARDADHVAAMTAARENAARLPKMPFPDLITVTGTTDLPEGPVLLAVPMQKLRQALQDLPDFGHRPLVACCKGIELSSVLSPTQVIGEVRPEAPAAILTGPSFAQDIARGLPTALTLACTDEALGQTLQEGLTTPNLRLYRTTDVPGAEIGGAVKNVMAIACGAAIGAGLGESARAALMTRGYAEMQRMALALGARPETLAGLSGFGDLALTCTSPLSLRREKCPTTFTRTTPKTMASGKRTLTQDTATGATPVFAVSWTTSNSWIIGLKKPLLRRQHGPHSQGLMYPVSPSCPIAHPDTPDISVPACAGCLTNRSLHPMQPSGDDVYAWKIRGTFSSCLSSRPWRWGIR